MQRLIIASVALVAFGLLFNWWVGKQEARGRHEGFVSLYVVAGVLTVLGAAAFVVAPYGAIALQAVGIVLALFLPAGLPMIYGSISRHATQREREERALADYASALIERD